MAPVSLPKADYARLLELENQASTWKDDPIFHLWAANVVWLLQIVARLDTAWPRVWCDGCQGIQPVIYDELPADERNDHAALDFVCGDCHLVIATLHAAAREPEGRP